MCQLCEYFSPLVLFFFFCRLKRYFAQSLYSHQWWQLPEGKATWAVTADHKELQKNRSLTEQWRIQDQFLSRGKSFWPQNQNEWTPWKTTKPLRYYTLSNLGKKCSQTVLENYTPSKMLRDFTMPGKENTPTLTEIVSLGLVFTWFDVSVFWFFLTCIEITKK